MSSTQADLVFVGGKIRTPAHPSGFVQALAVRDGVIAALGSDADIRELRGMQLAGVMQVSAVATDAVCGAVLGF